jgi:uroporphyrinogen-III synthase
VFPAIAILPPADDARSRARSALASYDAAVFVSANAAEYGAPGRGPRNVVAYATGPGTAGALHAVGVPEVAIPQTTYDSEGLLALPALDAVRGKRIAIFRGEGGRDHLADALARPWRTWIASSAIGGARPESGADGLAEALLQSRAHALTITSSEGLDNLRALVGRARARSSARDADVRSAPPHPGARPVARLQRDRDPSGDAGLIAGLLEWFARSRKPVT